MADINNMTREDIKEYNAIQKAAAAISPLIAKSYGDPSRDADHIRVVGDTAAFLQNVADRNIKYRASDEVEEKNRDLLFVVKTVAPEAGKELEAALDTLGVGYKTTPPSSDLIRAVNALAEPTRAATDPTEIGGKEAKIAK